MDPCAPTESTSLTEGYQFVHHHRHRVVTGMRIPVPVATVHRDERHGRWSARVRSNGDRLCRCHIDEGGAVIVAVTVQHDDERQLVVGDVAVTESQWHNPRVDCGPWSRTDLMSSSPLRRRQCRARRPNRRHRFPRETACPAERRVARVRSRRRPRRRLRRRHPRPNEEAVVVTRLFHQRGRPSSSPCAGRCIHQR